MGSEISFLKKTSPTSNRSPNSARPRRLWLTLTTMMTVKQPLKDSHWRGRTGAKIPRWSTSDTLRSAPAPGTFTPERIKEAPGLGKEAIAAAVPAPLPVGAIRAAVPATAREDEAQEVVSGPVVVVEAAVATTEGAGEDVAAVVAASRRAPMERRTRKHPPTSLQPPAGIREPVDHPHLPRLVWGEGWASCDGGREGGLEGGSAVFLFLLWLAVAVRAFCLPLVLYSVALTDKGIAWAYHGVPVIFIHRETGGAWREWWIECK